MSIPEVFTSVVTSVTQTVAKVFTWTSEQLAIFSHFEDGTKPHLVVRARAGTGKTTVILHAVSLATWASSILLCAFNKRIAEELKLKCSDPRTEIKTLHAIGFSFLKSLGRLRVEGDRELKIARTVCSRRDEILVPLVSKLAVKIKEIAPFGGLKDATDLAWRFDCLPEENGIHTPEDVARLSLRVCELSQRNDGTVSFADMLYLPLVLNLVRPYWDLVVVDEAQDMSPSQIMIAKQCVKPHIGRIVVVGDDRQGIYAFRGADSQTIDNLKSELSADELGLTVTHRCPKLVVSYAARLVPDYTAADSAPDGLIDTIKMTELVGSVAPGCFILSRKNAPLMGVCLSLLRAGIRSKIQGKDIAAQLLNLVRKMKATTVVDFISKLSTWREKEVKRAQARGNGVGTSREEVVHDIADTLIALAEDVKGMSELQDRIESLFSETHDVENSGLVICSSVHKAKGLEASHVFILADTLYPGNRRESLEEQNIEYVAVTRAQRHLTWVREV